MLFLHRKILLVVIGVGAEKLAKILLPLDTLKCLTFASLSLLKLTVEFLDEVFVVAQVPSLCDGYYLWCIFLVHLHLLVTRFQLVQIMDVHHFKQICAFSQFRLPWALLFFLWDLSQLLILLIVLLLLGVLERDCAWFLSLEKGVIFSWEVGRRY